MRLLKIEFDEYKQIVEILLGNGNSILDKIWPDWIVENRYKTKLTLNGSFKVLTKPTDVQLDAFFEFLSENGLETFFWRLNSFEEHAFRGNSFRETGMHADIQGMAIVIEHISRGVIKLLKGEQFKIKDDLIQQFKVIFAANASIVGMLKTDPAIKDVRHGPISGGQKWQEFNGHLERLRKDGSDGQIMADLLVTRFVRGSAHYKFPDLDFFEMEEIFVAIMRAAYHCFSATQLD